MDRWMAMGFGATFLMTACGHEGATRPVSHATVTQTARVDAPASKEAHGDVGASADLAKACKLQFGSAEDAPKFAYDDADLLPEDRDVLAQVAACVTTGPLKGQSLKLVGHADPRGESEYNLGLGARRAGVVRAYLGSLGVEKAKLTETSRGELDAKGSDEAGWRRDRRVDLDLAP